MRKFNVTVNGTAYEVEVEEIENGSAASAPAAVSEKPAAPSAAKAAPKAVPNKAPASGAAGSIKIEAPMQGTILKIAASAGKAVKKGDVVCVLEAMKMENDIVAPEDGTVVSVAVQQGASINTGDLICTMNPTA